MSGVISAIKGDAKARKLVLVIAAICVGVIVLSILNALGVLPDKERECVSRGDKYFQEIGEYPTLGDGRDAHDVAKERCSRTTTAF